MSKLSTSRLKDMISAWVSTPEIQRDLYIHDETHEEQERLWKLWCDGSQWKRREKRKLDSEEFKDQFTSIEYHEGFNPSLPGYKQPHRYVPYFDVDMAGHVDMELVKKYLDDPAQGSKCIVRGFEPADDFADNYRLEVFTTPEDDAVIAWTIIVD
jgi:hypothetical protein